MKPHLVPPRIGAQTSVDRKGEKRADAAYIAARFGCAGARVLPLIDLRVPIVPSADKTRTELRWMQPGASLLTGLAPTDFIYLGEREDAPLFAINFAPREILALASAVEALHPLVDLRSLALQGVLPQDELLLAGQARALCAWHAVNRCCPRCGGRSLLADGGWRRRCVSCGMDQYPRSDPAVIMLITRGDLCLLGHEHRFPQGLYSTLAGFVEPGDDIEHAVRREVMEEAGIEVGSVRYVASQPWPFPHSLMIGCWGEALTEAIRIDATELSDVRWFDRATLTAMVESRHPEGLFIPPSISMAHTLIRGFLSGALG
jgi:NAD+ diphosphatase